MGITFTRGIEAPRGVSRIGQRDERVVLAEGHGPGIRGHARHERTGVAIGDEGEGGLHLGVLRKRLRAGQEDRAPRRLHAIAALPLAAQPIRGMVRIPEEEVGGVDEHALSLGGLDREAPEHRPREGIGHGASLGGVTRARPVPVVLRDEQHARTGALETHDLPRPELMAVEAYRVRSESRGERDLVEELLVEPRHLHEQDAARVVPEERDEPVEPGHSRGAGGNRRQRRRLARGRAGDASRRQDQDECEGRDRERRCPVTQMD